MKTFTTLALLAATAMPAFAQWTPLGGGDHTGWDYTPPNGAVIGSDAADHSGVNVFTILDGTTVATGGVAPTVVIRGQTVVIDGNLDAVNNPLRIDAESSTVPAGSIPTLVSPLHLGFAGATPVWDWNDVSNLPTDNYVLQVSLTGVAGPGGSVSAPFALLKTTGFTGSSYVTLGPEALADGVYFWRVGRDDNNDGTIAGAEVWSEVWQVNIDTIAPTVPTLLSPADGACTTDSTPTFDWTDSFDINGVTYRIVVDNDPFFLSPEIDVSGLVASTYTPGVGLPFDPMQYFWFVTASDPAGNVATSAVFDFILDTVPPPAAGLLLPPDLSFTNDNTPLFDWDDAALGDPNFTDYTLQADNSGAGFPSPELNQSGIVPSTFTPGVGLADGVYSWRVRAFD